MDQSTKHTATINLRALVSQRDLIDRTAATLGKNRSDFILETACREAENVLVNHCLFLLDDAKFEVFNQLLKAPLKDNPVLDKLMAQKAPWE